MANENRTEIDSTCRQGDNFCISFQTVQASSLTALPQICTHSFGAELASPPGQTLSQTPTSLPTKSQTMYQLHRQTSHLAEPQPEPKTVPAPKQLMLLGTIMQLLDFSLSKVMTISLSQVLHNAQKSH